VIKLYDLPRIPGARRGAEAEARRLAQLQGPRVTGLLDVVIVGERMALVLAYVPGCNLGEYLAAHGRLPVPPPWPWPRMSWRAWPRRANSSSCTATSRPPTCSWAVTAGRTHGFRYQRHPR
jgi:hypothetical protein